MPAPETSPSPAALAWCLACVPDAAKIVLVTRLPGGLSANSHRIDVRSLLAPAARFELEIGPGRGGFILDRLAARPDVAIVGLEIRRKWASIVDERLARRGLASRGRVFAEDARSYRCTVGFG